MSQETTPPSTEKRRVPPFRNEPYSGSGLSLSDDDFPPLNVLSTTLLFFLTRGRSSFAVENEFGENVRLNFNTMFMELIDRIGGIAFWFFAWHYGCGR